MKYFGQQFHTLFESLVVARMLSRVEKLYNHMMHFSSCINTIGQYCNPRAAFSQFHVHKNGGRQCNYSQLLVVETILKAGETTEWQQTRGNRKEAM